jgi:hypothetical protein
MGTIRTMNRSFASGEISPELHGRVDLNKYTDGLAKCRNFITLPHGPARNRVGTEFVKEVSNSAKKTRLIPFSYNNTQTFAIELGAGFFRWHSAGATLLAGTPTAWNSGTAYAIGDMSLSGGRNYYCIKAHTNQVPPNATYWYAMPTDGTYEIPNSYAEADLFDIHYTQSADVLTLVHPSYPAAELRRYGATNWQLANISFASTVTAPTSVTATTSGPGGGTPVVQTYVATAVSNNNNLEESLASSAAGAGQTYTITGVTQANPGVLTTSVAHGRVAGDMVQISGVVGMTQLNGNTYWVNSVPTSTTMTLQTSATGGWISNILDTTAFTAYASGGTLTAGGAYVDLTVTGNKVTIAGTVASDIARVNVYKLSNGLYGLIGQALPTGGTFTFEDKNITADVSRTVPIPEKNAPNSSASYYPGAVGYFEQRRFFGGFSGAPQTVISTRSGTESNVNYHIPTVADDRLALRIAAREASTVRHIVPINNIILLTPTSEFKLSSTDGGAITGSTIQVRPQAYIGANNVQPLVVGGSVLYAQSRGGRVREMAYTWQTQTYVSNDISIMAPHLFDYYNIVDMCFQRAPHPIVWCVNDQGLLLGMTYVPEQQVSSWHWHDTDGVFESCCTITESNEDYLYLVVKRTINGSTKRYVERMRSRNFATLADNFFVDCGLTYSGAATTTITGLSHLEGKTVSVLGDGAVMPQCVVASGSITLSTAVSKAQIGLPITSDLETLPMAYPANDFGQGRPKNVNKVFLRVVNSSGVFAGPDFTNLVQYAQRTTEVYGSPPALRNDEIEIVLDNAWGTSGQVCIRQTDPLPLTIVSATLEVAVGG